MSEITSRTSTEMAIRHQRPWYVIENSSTVQLHLAQEIVWARLSECFRHVLTRRQGFLTAGLKFDGVINGNDVEIQYISRGRTTLKYTILGELSRTQEGTSLDLRLRENALRIALMNTITAFVVVLVATLSMGLRGLEMAALAVPAGFALAVFANAMYFAVGMLNRRAALASTADILTKMANGEFYQ